MEAFSKSQVLYRIIGVSLLLWVSILIDLSHSHEHLTAAKLTFLPQQHFPPIQVTWVTQLISNATRHPCPNRLLYCTFSIGLSPTKKESGQWRISSKLDFHMYKNITFWFQDGVSICGEATCWLAQESKARTDLFALYEQENIERTRFS